MGTSSLFILLTGFVLGLKHSTEADHLAAVSTLASQSSGPRHGARIGAWWGLGHSLTLFTLGGGLVLLRVQIPPRVAWALELTVAAVLIFLGARVLHRCLTGRYHFHAHTHAGHTHAHLHFHAAASSRHEHASHTPSVIPVVRPWPSLFVGMAHGLAGTAALTLLVLSTIPSRTLGLLYLVTFGAGALGGMALFGALLGLPLARAERRLGWLLALRLIAGSASLLLGLTLGARLLSSGLPPA